MDVGTVFRERQGFHAQAVLLIAAVATVALLLGLWSAAASDLGTPGPAPSADQAFGKLPLSFAPAMRGDAADYTASTAGGTVALGPAGATIYPAHRGATPLAVSLVGSRSVSPEALGRLPGVLNDLRGNDPSKWRRNVPTFARVRYPGVLPGIDMDWHGTSGSLEYDFRIAPNSDPSRIAVDFGDAHLRMTPGGGLVAGKGSAAVRQAAPVAYQRIGGERVPVQAAFTLDGDRAGFTLGHYDHSRPLVIDPLVLSYSTLLGSGEDYDEVKDIAIDSSGNAYLTGSTGGYTNPAPPPAFPTTSGAYDTTRSGNFDAFVTKLNPTGTAAVYSTLLGGSDTDVANGIAVDANGNAYVTGYSYSSSASGGTSYPVTAGAYETSTHGGWKDVFVTKLNAAGSNPVYSTYFGGLRGDDEARGIAIDSTGAAWIAGDTNSFVGNGCSGPCSEYPTVGVGSAGDPGDGFTPDMIVTKLNSTGTALDFSTYLGGTNQDEANDIDVDSSGRAFVAGFTTSYTDVPNNKTTMPFLNEYEGKTVGSNASNADAYIARFSSTGTLQYASALGGTGSDHANAIAADNSGGAYITGSTGDSSSFDLKSQYEGPNGFCCFDSDAFVAKFDTAASGANSLVYSTLLGGGGTESGQAIDVDSTGAAYVGGTTSSGVHNPPQPGNGTDFDVTDDRLAGTGGSAFVTKFVPAGNALAWSTTLPNGSSSAVETIYGLKADEAHDAVYFGGTVNGNAASSHPVTSGAFQTTPSGGTEDGFAGKLIFSSGPPDTTPPDTTINSGPADGSSTTDTTPTFAFTSTENPSTFECRYDSGAFTACTSPYTPASALALGQHTFQVRATDASNNVDPTPASRTFTVTATDTTPPDTSITSGPAAGSSTTDTTPTFAFTSTENPSTFECRYDSGAFTSCTSPYTGPALVLGSHTFQVRATDASNNTDPSPASRTFTVKSPPDTTPPQTTITKAPPAIVKSKRLPVTVSFSFSSSEAGSTFSCRIDGGAAKPCTSPASYDVGKGDHTFSVAARDKAGNADATPATAKVTVKKKRKRHRH